MKLNVLLMAASASFTASSALTAALSAPYIVGDRIFPATPTTAYPFVTDAAYAGLSRLRQGAPDAATRETALGFGFEKRLTADLGVDVEGAYKHIEGSEGTAYGFDDIEATLKYQLFLNDPHEFLFSIGVTREFGGSGAANVGAEAVSGTTPAIYFGKGFGDLPGGLKYLRPLAITGVLGYRLVDEDRHSTVRVDPQSGTPMLDLDRTPDQIVAELAIEYSLRYLQGNVAYLGLPSFIGRLTPLVEVKLATPVSTTFGTAITAIIAPGLIYSQRGIDFGVEALIPATRQSGTNIGFIASLHIPFEIFLPAAGSKPLFGGERP
jgi:hypothetical protein